MLSNNRSFGEEGSYTPSSSMMIVPTRPQNSSRVCRFTPVEGQARRLDRHDSADARRADRREQPIEAPAPDAASLVVDLGVN